MFFSDLSKCDYFGDVPENLVAVGWLANSSPFAVGSIPAESFAKLKSLCVDCWQPMVSCGSHECELCQFDVPRGSANLFIPDGTRIFVCPELVLHYIAAHHYRPPQCFLDAVMTCPNTRSMEYKKLILRSGGRALGVGLRHGSLDVGCSDNQ